MITFIEGSCTNNKHAGEKGFCFCNLSRFVGRFFSDKIKKSMWYTLLSLSLPCISRGWKTKQILLVRR